MTNLSIGKYVGGKRWNGFQCPNALDDRITVSSLLGGVPPSQGGPQGGMRIDASKDGSIEDDLLAAIYRFQTEQKKKNGLQMVDGVIKPGGETMRFLNRYCLQPVPPAESHRVVTRTDRFRIAALVEITWVWEDPGNPRFSPGNSDTMLGAKFSLGVVTASGVKGVSLLGPIGSLRIPGAKKLDRPMLLSLNPDFTSTFSNNNEDVTKLDREMEASDFASRQFTIRVGVQGTGPVSVVLDIEGVHVVHRDPTDRLLRDRDAGRRLVPIDNNPLQLPGPNRIVDLGLANLEWKGTLQKVSEF